MDGLICFIFPMYGLQPDYHAMVYHIGMVCEQLMRFPNINGAINEVLISIDNLVRYLSESSAAANLAYLVYQTASVGDLRQQMVVMQQQMAAMQQQMAAMQQQMVAVEQRTEEMGEHMGRLTERIDRMHYEASIRYYVQANAQVLLFKPLMPNGQQLPPHVVFPQTPAELRAMTVAQLNPLCQMYGLAHNGNRAQKLRRVQEFLGITPL
ncbi:hypothetical protein DFH11DRAFT_1610407 [Phellopilus nigrolimitatus]|nr:hypothetical protein DFH11DRAFT_1610407 [Phellopilus nigrolimitatus]